MCSMIVYIAIWLPVILTCMTRKRDKETEDLPKAKEANKDNEQKNVDETIAGTSPTLDFRSPAAARTPVHSLRK